MPPAFQGLSQGVRLFAHLQEQQMGCIEDLPDTDWCSRGKNIPETAAELQSGLFHHVTSV